LPGQSLYVLRLHGTHEPATQPKSTAHTHPTAPRVVLVVFAGQGVHEALPAWALTRPRMHGTQDPWSGSSPAAHTGELVCASPSACNNCSAVRVTAAHEGCALVGMAIQVWRTAASVRALEVATDKGRPLAAAMVVAKLSMHSSQVESEVQEAMQVSPSALSMAVARRASTAAGSASWRASWAWAGATAARTEAPSVRTLAAAPVDVDGRDSPGPQSAQHTPGPAVHLAPSTQASQSSPTLAKLMSHTHACALVEPLCSVVLPGPQGMQVVLPGWLL
jgi:hypothetical protein